MTLDVRGLVAGYGRSTVLQGVDLDVAPGSVLGLLGRNGVGKTTLINTIMGLIKPMSGSISLDGQELAGRRSDQVARAGLALVPQGRRIWPNLDVSEHLSLSASRVRRRGRGSAADLDSSGNGPVKVWDVPAILELLPRLGERRSHLGGQLSGGEQQMLAIARALLTSPTVLLMDEPSDGLAPTVVDQIGGVIGELKRAGVTVLLVEQDLHLAFGVADEIAVMVKGAIAHRCSTGEFRADEATARRLLGVS